MSAKLVIEQRERIPVTHNAVSKFVWTDWEVLETTTEIRKNARLEYWRGLNAESVSYRGAEAKREFRVSQAA